ncbi:hypothetical protein COCON_G00043580 [Conger conger]|uniref:Uncharacterized protein n=1 Tax=Conger conger TaxID=82655 RepID=A0A9Q1DU89_CONCO|nr:hypothetical protein COCON_G00043580 [Conger conger]
MITLKTDDEDMVYNRMRSKIWGFSVVLGLVVGYFFYLFWNCRRSPEKRYRKMYKAQLDEDREVFARTPPASQPALCEAPLCGRICTGVGNQSPPPKSQHSESTPPSPPPPPFPLLTQPVAMGTPRLSIPNSPSVPHARYRSSS